MKYSLGWQEKAAGAWVRALAQMTEVLREHEADAEKYKYKYADLAGAVAPVRVALAEHGLAVHQEAVVADGHVKVATRVWHESGEWLEAAPMQMPARGGPQDIGSLLTYSRRYALMAFLGLATDDDDAKGAQQASKDADATVHPLSERVNEAITAMKALTNAQQGELREWADGRRLSGGYLLRNEEWLAAVEAKLDAFADETRVREQQAQATRDARAAEVEAAAAAAKAEREAVAAARKLPTAAAAPSTPGQDEPGSGPELPLADAAPVEAPVAPAEPEAPAETALQKRAREAAARVAGKKAPGDAADDALSGNRTGAE
jgi:ERF superfamily